MGQISSKALGVTQEECAGIKGGYREIKENQKSAGSTRRRPVGCGKKEHGAWSVVSNTGFRGLQGRPKAGCEGCGLMFNDGSSGALAQSRRESCSQEP